MHTKIMAAWDEKKKKFKKAAVHTKVSSAEKKDLSGEPSSRLKKKLVGKACHIPVVCFHCPSPSSFILVFKLCNITWDEKPMCTTSPNTEKPDEKLKYDSQRSISCELWGLWEHGRKQQPWVFDRSSQWKIFSFLIMLNNYDLVSLFVLIPVTLATSQMKCLVRCVCPSLLLTLYQLSVQRGKPINTLVGKRI